MSYMYSLLNHIAATSKETFEVSSALRNSLDADTATLYSLETGLRGLSEDEKRLVGISTISVVTRLALEFKTEEVCHPGAFRKRVIDTEYFTGHSPHDIYATTTSANSRTNSGSSNCV